MYVKVDEEDVEGTDDVALANGTLLMLSDTATAHSSLV